MQEMFLQELSLVKSIIESKNGSTVDTHKIQALKELSFNYDYVKVIDLILSYDNNDDLLNQSVDFFALFVLAQQRGDMKGIGGFSNDMALLTNDEINKRCEMYDQRFVIRNQLRKKLIDSQ